MNVNRHTAGLWRRRFRQEGLDGVWEIAPGRGRKPSHSEKTVAAIVKATLESKPKGRTGFPARQSPPAARARLAACAGTEGKDGCARGWGCDGRVASGAWRALGKVTRMVSGRIGERNRH